MPFEGVENNDLDRNHLFQLLFFDHFNRHRAPAHSTVASESALSLFGDSSL